MATKQMGSYPGLDPKPSIVPGTKIFVAVYADVLLVGLRVGQVQLLCISC